MNGIEVTKHVLGVVMIQQYSLNTGLKNPGKDGEVVVTKELAQLHH